MLAVTDLDARNIWSARRVRSPAGSVFTIEDIVFLRSLHFCHTTRSSKVEVFFITMVYRTSMIQPRHTPTSPRSINSLHLLNSLNILNLVHILNSLNLLNFLKFLNLFLLSQFPTISMEIFSPGWRRLRRETLIRRPSCPRPSLSLPDR